MGIWSGIKHALNDTLGTSSFQPLNQIVKSVETTLTAKINTNETNIKSHVSTSGSTTVARISSSESAIKTAISNSESSLHSHIREMRYQPLRVITTTGTFKPEKTGLYKVICVGQGGNGRNLSPFRGGGGGGGLAVKTLTLSSATTYNVTIGELTSFGNILTAEAGTMPLLSGSTQVPGYGGTASGGDNNYRGEDGETSTSDTVMCKGGSVGCTIGELSRQFTYFAPETEMFHIHGECILNYGGGGAVSRSKTGTSTYTAKEDSGRKGAVIIIPLEMEE